MQRRTTVYTELW